MCTIWVPGERHKPLGLSNRPGSHPFDPNLDTNVPSVVKTFENNSSIRTFRDKIVG